MKATAALRSRIPAEGTAVGLLALAPPLLRGRDGARRRPGEPMRGRHVGVARAEDQAELRMRDEIGAGLLDKRFLWRPIGYLLCSHYALSFIASTDVFTMESCSSWRAWMHLRRQEPRRRARVVGLVHGIAGTNLHIAR